MLGMTPTPPQIGQMPQILLQEAMEALLRTALHLPLLLGITMLPVDLTRAVMEDLEEEVHHTAEAEAEVEAAVLPADQAMGSGKMANTSLDLSTNEWSVNFLVSPMTLQSCRLVSTFLITTIFLLKHPARKFQNLACSSRTLLWTIIYFPISDSQATRLPHPCKSILFPSSWVVET